MCAKLGAWLFERLYSLKTAFETVVPLVLTVLPLGFVYEERCFLRALEGCLEKLADFVFHEAFQGKRVELRQCNVLCEVRGVQLGFKWFTPVGLSCLWIGTLEAFVIAGFAFVIYKFVSLLILRRFLLEAFLITEFALIAYFFFGPLLSRGGQSIGFVKWSFFGDLFRRSLEDSIDVGLGGTTHPIPRACFEYWFGLYHPSCPSHFVILFFGFVCVFGFVVGLCGSLPAPRPFVPKTWKFSLWWTFGVCLGVREIIGWRTA